MKFWWHLDSEPVDQLLRLARDAEELGFEGVTMPEHVVLKTGDRTPHPTGVQIPSETEFPDPMCAFSAMSAVTTRLRFMPFVYVVPLRNPFALAKQVSTLALLSDNRFVLGTGVGWLPEEFQAVGQDFTTRGRRMNEMLEVMRQFWSDGYSEQHGEFFDFPRSGMFPVPTQRVPVWIGGHSNKAAIRAAQHDGYMPMDGLHDRTRQEFAAIDSYRSEHGLDGPYERVVVAAPGADPGEIRRMEAEDRITAVTVHPGYVYGRHGTPITYEEKRGLAERYATEVLAKV